VGEVADYIVRAGHSVRVLDKNQVASVSDIFSPHSDSFTFGSIDLVRLVERTTSWSPGFLANWRGLECTSYYANHYKYLLNQTYIFMTLPDLLRQWSDISFSLGPALFLRPNNGWKNFTGQTVKSKDEVKVLSDSCPRDLLVMISPAQTAFRGEWRLFCKAGEGVITGSQYYDEHGELKVNRKIPRSVWEFGDEICREREGYAPDPLFVADITLHSGRYPRLIELNSWSSSGWYAADYTKIIDETVKYVDQMKGLDNG